MPAGQCDGLADVAYPGSGHNQHCAFKDVRYFWQDGSYTTGKTFPGWGWVGAGGDTYLIRGSLATNVTYRIGWNNPNNSYDPYTQQYWGIQGDPFDSYMPPPPSGTAAAHTRILGENYASCSTASAKTQLHGGYGVYEVIDMEGVANVDLACLDITDFSQCALTGSASVPCNKSTGTLTDDAQNGISWNNAATNDTLTNVHIHGLALNGMRGPTGNGMVFKYLDLIGNSSSGWNSDNGAGNPSAVGVGSLLVQNFNFSWNGCTEEYPMVDALPYSQCADDSSSGYGDAFGTATQPSTPPGWQVHFDQGVVSYNTQDGLDALHLVGNGSSMTITRVLAYGNMGQQIKVGGRLGTAENNIIITNCNAMRQAIPGTPAGYNKNLSDFCRAADTGVLVTVGKGSKTTFDNNTIYSASATGVEVECDPSNGSCDGTSLIDFRNNIFVGFLNNQADGYTGPSETGSQDYSNPIYDGTGLWPFGSNGSEYTDNIIFHPKSNFNCPRSGQICLDPMLTDETWHSYGYPNAVPLPGSPAVGKGVNLAGITLDFNGVTRTAAPTIGALEIGSTPQATSAPTAPSSPSQPVTSSPVTPPTSTTPPVSSNAPVVTQIILTVTKAAGTTPAVLTATVNTAAGKIPSGTVTIFTAAKWALASGVLNSKGSVSWQVPASLSKQIVYGVFNGNASFAGSTSLQASLSGN